MASEIAEPRCLGCVLLSKSDVGVYLLQREYDRIWALTKPSSPDAVRKISGFLNKVKDRADDRIQSMANTGSPETQRKLTGMLAKVKEGAEKAKVRTTGLSKDFF